MGILEVAAIIGFLALLESRGKKAPKGEVTVGEVVVGEPGGSEFVSFEASELYDVDHKP